MSDIQGNTSASDQDRTPLKIKTGFFDRYFSLGVSQGGLAGHKADPYSYSGLPSLTAGVVLPRRDDILLEEAGGGARAIEQYMRLFNDSQTLAAWEKLVGEIIQRKWEVYPASTSDRDEEVAEFIRQAIYRMGSNTRQSYGKDMLVSSNSAFNSFVRGLCESLILGISIGEICWMRQGEYIVPAEIKIRDPRRFLFLLNEDGSISPRVITISSPVEGMPIPMRSMIIHRHWCYSNFMDPYGTGLGRQLYALTEIRRTLMSFWLQYADKHTTPTAVGKFSLGTPEEEVNSLFTALQRLGQETAIVIPDEMSVEWLESNAGRPEVYTDLINYVDQQMSFLINGETTVGQETGSVGSFARDQVADSVRMRKAKAFSEEIDETLTSTLVRWLVELNYPGAPVPRFKRNFEDLEQREDPVKVVQMITQLQAVGYEIKDLDWLRDRLEIPSLTKIDMSEMGMGQDAPMGEADIDKTIVPHVNLDFSEFDENGDLKDQTQKDKLSKTIAERFAGKVSEVGWDRVTVDETNSENQMDRIRVDEHTTPGQLVFITNRLLEEIRNREKMPQDYMGLVHKARTDLGEFDGLVRRDEPLYEEQVKRLIKVYQRSYKLNRAIVHNEYVVVDPEAMGYWSSFAPYYMCEAR
jgi:phage gp29-like protein